MIEWKNIFTVRIVSKMGHYLVLFFFWCFVAFVVALVIRAIIVTLTAPAPKPAVDQVVHEHEWRQVTAFVRQCKVMECSKVEFGDDVPDGMASYVKLMTSRQAYVDPNGEASHYPELDPRAWGPKCSVCDRIIGFPWNIPRSPWLAHNSLLYDCPYCQETLIFIDAEKKWRKA